MLKSSLCAYSDAHIHAKETMTIPNTAASNNTNKKIILKIMLDLLMA